MERGPAPPADRRRLAVPDGARGYASMLDCIASQIDGQLSHRRPVSAAICIPAVGFGMQSSAVLVPTLRVALGLRSAAGPIAVVVVVNRPAHEPADETVAAAREAVDGDGSGAAIASVLVPGTPLLGELRQLAADAVAPYLGPDAPIVVCDDDLTWAPPATIDRIASALAPDAGGGLAVGPVLFDDEARIAALVPEFHLGDLLRALLAARLLSRLSRLDRTCPQEEAAARRLGRLYFESAVLSCNLGVSSAALASCGGFRDRNEITGIASDVHERFVATDSRHSPVVGLWHPDASDDPVAELLSSAVRVSPRRALHALARGQGASVAQWRACRFRSDRVDPVRVLPTPIERWTLVGALSSSERRALVDRVELVVATTLSYFEPDEAAAHACLRDLGVAGAIVAALDGDRWTVSARHPGRVLDVLAEHQFVAGSAVAPPGSPVP